MASQLALHVCFRGFRWPLRDNDDVQVWTVGHELLATLPGRLIRQLIELHLAGVVMHDNISALVKRPAARLPARAIVPDQERREELRKQRRSRRTLSR